MEQPAAVHLWSLRPGTRGFVESSAIVIDAEGRCFADENAMVWPVPDGGFAIEVGRRGGWVEVRLERAAVAAPWSPIDLADRWRLTPVRLSVDGADQPLAPVAPGASGDLTAVMPPALRAPAARERRHAGR